MADAPGTLGMLLPLGAFLANVAGSLPPTGIVYQALNAAGDGLLAWYSVYREVWIFAVLKGVWTFAALVNLTRAVARNRG